jgi:hypothetical protein
MKRVRLRHIKGSYLWIVLWLCCWGVAMGQADQPTLDDLLDLTPAPTETTQADTTGSDAGVVTESDDDLNESVGRALSASDASDAFEQAVDQMDDVSRRLGRAFDPGVETQRMQESILRKLDQVIASAKEQSSSGGGGGSGEPKKQDKGGDELAQQQAAAGEGGDQAQPGGQQASSGAAGSGSPIKPEGQDTVIRQLRKEWGVLPPRVREELSDGLRERFSPLYRQMTEAYYKALAEQE